MKKFLLGSVAVAALGIGAPAIAADMAVRPVAPVRAFSWTGCHIGGLVGYEWGHDDGYSTTAGSTVVFTGPTAAGRHHAVGGWASSCSGLRHDWLHRWRLRRLRLPV